MNLSSITDNLFIGKTPSAEDYGHLRMLKFASQWDSRKRSLYNYESQ
ncbi:MAG: hypothetical protein IH588_10990 [Anaerolineales bacterium]|nr:hypothetical protein [Anaerolineales bacterium]